MLIGEPRPCSIIGERKANKGVCTASYLSLGQRFAYGAGTELVNLWGKARGSPQVGRPFRLWRIGVVISKLSCPMPLRIHQQAPSHRLLLRERAPKLPSPQGAARDCSEILFLSFVDRTPVTVRKHVNCPSALKQYIFRRGHDGVVPPFPL